MQGDITLIGSALTPLAGSLATLDLSDNYLSGSLSAEQNGSAHGNPQVNNVQSNNPLCQLTDGALEFLNIQINNVTGDVPGCLFQKGMHVTLLTADRAVPAIGVCLLVACSLAAE